MRVLLYARYSTDLQDPLSTDTQLTMYRHELVRREWTEIGWYTDGAQSRGTIHRAGLQALLAAVGTGGVDVVFADAMDRVSRSQADIASLYERLRFRGIRPVTRKEGEVGALHVGMMRTINAEQIAAMKARDTAHALPFFAQQRPKYLTTGKMTCGECGSSYAKSGRTRFGCQGASKKGPAFCGNRLTIRQDELDAHILAGLANEMIRDEVLAVFLEEYAAETACLQASATDCQPQRDLERMEIDRSP